jgi:hypothetical protein
LKGLTRDPARAEKVDIVRGERRRRLHKAFLRWHDANNWPLLRQALMDMGRADLIGNGKQHLIPTFQPAGTGGQGAAWRNHAATARVVADAAHPSPAQRQPKPGRLLTQHTGLPPREAGGRLRPAKAGAGAVRRKGR